MVKAGKKAGYPLKKGGIKRRDGTPEKLPPHVDPAVRRYVQQLQWSSPLVSPATAAFGLIEHVAGRSN